MPKPRDANVPASCDSPQLLTKQLGHTRQLSRCFNTEGDDIGHCWAQITLSVSIDAGPSSRTNSLYSANNRESFTCKICSLCGVLNSQFKFYLFHKAYIKINENILGLILLSVRWTSQLCDSSACNSGFVRSNRIKEKNQPMKYLCLKLYRKQAHKGNWINAVAHKVFLFVCLFYQSKHFGRRYKVLVYSEMYSNCLFRSSIRKTFITIILVKICETVNDTVVLSKTFSNKIQKIGCKMKS